MIERMRGKRLGAQVDESLKKVSKVEQEAERFFGKIVLILSETQPVELSLLAKMLYLRPEKLRYWLIKRRMWNDCVVVEKKKGRWYVYLSGPKKCWLAAVYKLHEPEPKPEFGNELFKRMVSIGDGLKRAIFAHKLEDGSILLCTFDTQTRKFLFHIPLKPEDVLSNGEIYFRFSNERVKRILQDAFGLFGLVTEMHIDEKGRLIEPPYLVGWIFETIHVVLIDNWLLNRALDEKVVVLEGQ